MATLAEALEPVFKTPDMAELPRVWSPAAETRDLASGQGDGSAGLGRGSRGETNFPLLHAAVVPR